LLGAASLIAALSPLAIGCNLPGLLRSKERTPEKVERTPVPHGPVTLPGKYDVRIPPFVFLSDFEIPRQLPLLQELGQLREQVYKHLLLPTGTAVVQVYLFETQERYEAFMKGKFPSLPSRRAYFVAQPRVIGGADELVVYTYWGKRIRQDLRHELTHALLHSVIKDVPQWLDEGLAEYFELPPENRGVNVDHVAVLQRELASRSYRLNLSRLEGLKEVDDMRPEEYREAWAWVHLMLHSSTEARGALLGYLQQLRGLRNPGPLGPRLAKVFPDPEKALTEHLARMEMTLVRAQPSAFPTRP